MSIWHIYGGNRLTGSTRVQGAKNAVLPIMAASVLSGGETVLHNVPDLRDVTTTLRILQHLGCTAVRDGDTVRIDSRGMHCDFIPHALMRELRSSVIFLGAILARFGTARLSMPGGCELGPRPVNLALGRAARARRGGHGARRRHHLPGARASGAAHPAAVSERRRNGKRHARRLRSGGGDGYLQCRARAGDRRPAVLPAQARRGHFRRGHVHGHGRRLPAAAVCRAHDHARPHRRSDDPVRCRRLRRRGGAAGCRSGTLFDRS